MTTTSDNAAGRHQRGKIRAVFVNATERTVEDVVIERGLQPMYDTIGCSLVDIVHLDDCDDLFIDDEGLLKVEPHSPFFRIGDVTLAGNGLIVGGNDDTGESCDVHRDAAHYRQLITFTHSAADAMRRKLLADLSFRSPF
jgi:hypothetical protein